MKSINSNKFLILIVFFILFNPIFTISLLAENNVVVLPLFGDSNNQVSINLKEYLPSGDCVYTYTGYRYSDDFLDPLLDIIFTYSVNNTTLSDRWKFYDSQGNVTFDWTYDFYREVNNLDGSYSEKDPPQISPFVAGKTVNVGDSWTQAYILKNYTSAGVLTGITSRVRLFTLLSIENVTIGPETYSGCLKIIRHEGNRISIS